MFKKAFIIAMFACVLITTSSCKKSVTPTANLYTLCAEIEKDSLLMSVAEWEKKLQSYMAIVNEFAKTTHKPEELIEFQNSIDDLYRSLLTRRDTLDIPNLVEACRNVKDDDLRKLRQSLDKIKVMYEKDMQVLEKKIKRTENEMEKLFNKRREDSNNED